MGKRWDREAVCWGVRNVKALDANSGICASNVRCIFKCSYQSEFVLGLSGCEVRNLCKHCMVAHIHLSKIAYHLSFGRDGSGCE